MGRDCVDRVCSWYRADDSLGTAERSGTKMRRAIEAFVLPMVIRAWRQWMRFRVGKTKGVWDMRLNMWMPWPIRLTKDRMLAFTYEGDEYRWMFQYGRHHRWWKTKD